MDKKIKRHLYKVTYELELYADSQSEAVSVAAGHAITVAEKVRGFPARVWDDEKDLPTGILQGSPYTVSDLYGWRCHMILARVNGSSPKDD